VFLRKLAGFKISMAESSFDNAPTEKSGEKRLDSWKEIAAYLARDVTTAQRWEKREGMPVHRHVHEKRGSVYAVPTELDDWIKSRKPSLQESDVIAEAVPVTEAEGRKLSHGTARVPILIALCLCVAVATFFVLRRSPMSTAPPQSTAPNIRSLAVLPLRNISGDPAQEYLADGITEALIGRLSEIKTLRVTSHTSVLQFRNPHVSVPEIARTLGVDAVVEGSVMKEGSRIRITAQLIQGATDQHVWSQTYDREMRDALSLESELAQSVAEKVTVR
jgi:TolB-like protein